MTPTRLAIVTAGAVALVACRAAKFPAVPGATDISVTGVEIEPKGETHGVAYEPLIENLGLRKGSKVRPARNFNPYRLAEDRRRILTYLQEQGYFDAVVDEPEVTYAADRKSVAVAWHVTEGVGYTIASVEIVGAPPQHLGTLRAMVPFGQGDHLDIAIWRPLRRALAERLQDEGYGHARGYSRTFVDRDRKTVAWFYYLDPGPLTRIAAITVEGNARLPADAILARVGLAPGDPYSTTAKRRAELALLDTGAFASVVVLSDAEIQTGPPELPETGGVLAPEQVSADGTLVPRQLPETVAVRVVVVEAPRRQFRAELGIEGDPTRVDAYAGARVIFRDLFAPQHHLVLEARAGYGWIVGDDDELAEGLYGSALAQYLHPGFLARTLDLRITGRWRDVLYPDALLREVVAGPGVRTTLAHGVYLDLDAFYRFGRTIDLPALDPMTTAELALPASRDSAGLELVASLIADRRDDRVEPTRGWFLGFGSTFSPGGALADDRWLQLTADARAFMPIKGALSLGLRASAGWVVAAGATGVPLGARLFGGGAYGMRGFGRDRLSPAACELAATDCDVLVGGRSLVEASAELRFLPFRKQYGLATFVDAGGAGAKANAFEDGISIAAGLGLRLRIWYLPVSIDIAYRLVDENTVGAAFDRLLVFFRVGEAF
ncbi:MAG: BamA/TamA family outer membrane protein [Kofleriaceae bacterium]